MNDEELIDYIANAWVEHGGDTKGFNYLWMRIRKKIFEKRMERNIATSDEVCRNIDLLKADSVSGLRGIYWMIKRWGRKYYIWNND